MKVSMKNSFIYNKKIKIKFSRYKMFNKNSLIHNKNCIWKLQWSNFKVPDIFMSLIRHKAQKNRKLITKISDFQGSLF